MTEEECINLGDDRVDNGVNDSNNGGQNENSDDEDEVGREVLKQLSELTTDDILGMSFTSLEAATVFYERYAQCKGFVVRKDDLRRDADKNIVGRELVCNKQGTRHKKYLTRVDRVREAKPISRVACPARIRVVFERETCLWKVNFFEESHNHELQSPDNVRLIAAYRRMSEGDKAQIDSLITGGCKPCTVMSVVSGQKGGNENTPFLKADLYNYVEKKKRERDQNGDAVAALSYLQAKTGSDPLLFFKFNKDTEGNLRNLFWCDGVSRVDYHVFGDVLVFDSTYKKNKYNKPLVIFCGYNHHGQTAIFSCALVGDESIESYKWVLQTFAECMFDKHPKAVVTDGCPSMREAIRTVFPNTKHRLCGWHIQKNAVDHVKISEFLEDFAVLIYGNFTEEKFESFWEKVIEKYDLSNDPWIQKMYECRNMWATAYMRDHFFAGIRTTSMCEGINSFIKQYVQSKNGVLDFIHNFERALKEYRSNEFAADFKTSYTDPYLSTSLPRIEGSFSKHLTREKYMEVKSKILAVGDLIVVQRLDVNDVIMTKMSTFENERREYVVLYDKIDSKLVCDCGHFEYYGIPCAHIICVMRNERVQEVLLSLICKRWSRTAKVDSVNKIHDVGNDSKAVIMLRQGALSAAVNILGKVACEHVNDFTELLEDVYKLVDKYQKRTKTNSNIPIAPFQVGDPTVCKSKGAPRKGKDGKKTKKCSKCRKTGHTIRTCPDFRKRDAAHNIDFGDSSVELDEDSDHNEARHVNPSNGTNELRSTSKSTAKGKKVPRKDKVVGKSPLSTDTLLMQTEQNQAFVLPPNYATANPFFNSTGLNAFNGISMFPQFPETQMFYSYPPYVQPQDTEISQAPKFMGLLDEVQRKASKQNDEA